MLNNAYMDGSFIPLDGNDTNNTTGSDVHNPANNLQITETLPRLQNILKVKLNTILITINNTQHHPQDTHFFTDSLIVYTSYIITYNTNQPNTTTQINYLIVAIVNQITWCTYKSTIRKVTMHTGIIGNEIADQRTNDGSLLDKPPPLPRYIQPILCHYRSTGSQPVPTRALYATYKHTSAKNTRTKN